VAGKLKRSLEASMLIGCCWLLVTGIYPAIPEVR